MISFIIPAKNEENYIGDCLRSIMAQKSSEPFEVVVVDNNSQDRTSVVCKEACPSARVFREEADGTSAARQKGFMESKGDLLVFLDADVRLPDTDWLNRVLLKVKSNPKVVAFSTHYKYYDLPKPKKLLQTFGQFVFVYPWLFLVNTLLKLTATMIGGMMIIRKQSLEKAGGFLATGEFYGDEAAVSIKLYKIGAIQVSPKLWVFTSGRRYKGQGLLRSVFKNLVNYFSVLFKGEPYHKDGYKPFR